MDAQLIKDSENGKLFCMSIEWLDASGKINMVLTFKYCC